MKRLLLTMMSVALCLRASAQDVDAAVKIHLTPIEPIYLNQTNQRYGYSDLVLHNIGISNTSPKPIEMRELILEAQHMDLSITSRVIRAPQLVIESNRLKSSPLPIFNEFTLLTQGGEVAFLEGAQLAQSAILKKDQGLITRAHHMSVPSSTQKLKITAIFKDSNQEIVKETRMLDVRLYKSPIEYHLPLSGSWFMRALPGIESHHRLNASTEFAVDFFKLSAKGRVYEGDRINASSYLGYGEPVKAAADGEIVHIESAATQDRQAFKLKDNETPRQRGQRLQSAMFNAIKENAKRAFGGNLVTIKHEKEGVVEYSSYGHLKAGSIKVQIGDRVTAGQIIGEVGDTGDSPEVHLHFQVNAGPDAFMSKSLPFKFDDIKQAISPAEPGLVIHSDKTKQ